MDRAAGRVVDGDMSVDDGSYDGMAPVPAGRGDGVALDEPP